MNLFSLVAFGVRVRVLFPQVFGEALLGGEAGDGHLVGAVAVVVVVAVGDGGDADGAGEGLVGVDGLEV